MAQRRSITKLTWLAGSACVALAAGQAQAQEAIPTAPPAVTPSNDPQARIAALEAEVQALAAQVSDLKAATIAQITDVRTTATATTVSLANARPVIATADGNFTAALRSTVHLDTAEYYQKDNLPPSVTTGRDLSSGTVFRRARLAMEGKAFKYFDYNFTYEFGGAGAEDAGRLYEASVQYNGPGVLKLKAGAYAPTQGLEDSASTNGGIFVERPSPAEATRAVAGGDSRVAASILAVSDRWLAAASITGRTLSSLNTQATGFTAPNFDQQKGYVIRVAGTPLKGYDWRIHLGANASWVIKPGDAGSTAAVRFPIQVRDRPEMRVDGARLVDSGALNADGANTWGLEFAAQWRNLFLQAEDYGIEVDRLDPAAGVTDPKFRGWYAEASWVVTGEARRYQTASGSFDAPAVAKPFDPSLNQWGALELGVRYSDLDLNHDTFSSVAADRVRGGDQQIWTVGANWYLNSVIRFMLDYQNVDVDRLTAAGTQAGQRYKALVLRSQFAF